MRVQSIANAMILVGSWGGLGYCSLCTQSERDLGLQNKVIQKMAFTVLLGLGLKIAEFATRTLARFQSRYCSF